eukprot:gene42238-52374_t
MAVLKGNADWFERRRVAQVIGISTAIAAVGSMVTTVPVQALLPTLGWRGVFWVLCAVTLAVALWIFLAVPEKPRGPGPAPTLGGYLASSARILASPTFWLFGPAVATISTFNFAYLGLWAGPWLRDVAGMDGATRAGVLFLYTLAMIAGSVLTGSAASRVNSPSAISTGHTTSANSAHHKVSARPMPSGSSIARSSARHARAAAGPPPPGG